MRRIAALLTLLTATGLLISSSASAQEALLVSITSRQTSHLWTETPAQVGGRATLPDGQPAAGRRLIVESRPYPFSGPFAADGEVLAGVDGRFTYERRPTKNVQIRIRGDAGQFSPIVTLRVFAAPQEGDLKARSDGRQRALETSLVPPGFRIAKVYLYFCRPKAKVCKFAKTGKARISGQRMTATATFRPPAKYADKRYTVFFRYVPKAGWGDSNTLERARPKTTLHNEDP